MRGLFIFFSLFLLAGCSGPADRNVLFIGNSYTQFNNLPLIVEEISDANGVSINTEMIAPGGAFLGEHVMNPLVTNAIRSGDFDTVVFQEQAVVPSLPEVAEQLTIPAAISLDQIADAVGVDVIWFQTWGHLDGLPSEGHDSYESMQAPIIDTYDEIAVQTGGSVARVGEAWQRARANSSVGLYDADGSHPSPAGSYLAAVEITETLISGPILETPAVPGVDEETAAALANG